MQESNSSLQVRSLGILKLACGLMAIICLAWAQAHSPFHDLRSGYILNSESSNWLTVSNLDYSSTHTWAIDPISSLAFDAEHYITMGGFGLPIFIFALWLFWTSLVRPTQALSLTVIVTCFLLAFYGADPIIFSSLACMPFVLLGLNLTLTKHKLAGFILTFSSTIMLTLSANQFGLLSAILALTWCQYNLDKDRTKSYFLAALLLVGIPLGYLFFIPLPDLDEIGKTALPLTLFNDLVYNNRIDRAFVRFAFNRITLGLGLLAILILFLRLKKESTNYKLIQKHHVYIGVLAIIAILDSVAPEFVAQASPLAGFAKLIPNNYTSPLLPIYFAIIILLISTSIIIKCKKTGVFFWFLALTVLIFGRLRPEQNLPYLTNQKNLRNEIMASLTCPTYDQILGTAIPVWLKLKGLLPCTFSKGLINLPLSDDFFKVDPSKPEKRKIKLSSSRLDRARLAGRLRDGNTRTDWRTKLTTSPDDWIRVDFENPIKIHGITLKDSKEQILQPDKYQVAIGQNCEQSIADRPQLDMSWKEVRTLTIKPAINFTKSGKLYFTDRDSSIIFAEPISISCLKISPAIESSQIWGISELEIVTERKKS